MEKKLKIVFADDSTEFSKNCERTLKGYGMEVISVKKDGLSVISKVKSEKPDVVLAEVFLTNIDILGILAEIKKMNAKETPLVMVMSSFANQRLEKEILEAGASYYFLKPFDVNIMAQRIMQISGSSKTSTKKAKPYTSQYSLKASRTE